MKHLKYYNQINELHQDTYLSAMISSIKKNNKDKFHLFYNTFGIEFLKKINPNLFSLDELNIFNHFIDSLSDKDKIEYITFLLDNSTDNTISQFPLHNIFSYFNPILRKIATMS